MDLKPITAMQHVPWRLTHYDSLERDLEQRESLRQLISVARSPDGKWNYVVIIHGNDEVVWRGNLDADASRHLAKLLTQGLPE